MTYRNIFVNFTDDMLDIHKIINKEVDMKDTATVLNLMYDIANATILHEDVQNLLHSTSEEFDAVIAEWMYSELYSGFAAVFNCPLIWFLSVYPHNMALSLIDMETNPAYTADHIKSNSIPPFTFWERVNELRMLLHWKFYRWWVNDRDSKSFDKAFKAAAMKRSRTLLPLDELKYNGSLMFGNSHVSTGDAIALPRNFIDIAGYHINRTVKPLPEDIKIIMDRATVGVIFFSMGSMLKSSKMPQQIKNGILQIFGKLKQTVIWKFEEALPDLPKNVHILNWAPQQSILAHPNCVLFITHGGLLSTTEALHFGVPIIGIPMFADQFINVNRAVAKGFAKRVDLNYETPENLKMAIEEILGTPKYRERVKELSFIYNDRALQPGSEIIRWVHHVIKTRGAPHLRSPALLVPLYQKLYLDLIFLIIITVLTLIVAIKIVVNKRHTVDIPKKLS
ncbi:unnamed protein product [Parnassius apollo]|uniref:UDP-glucuronosyltransferase n=1 Tax=Parnassius apollo TaxID=110799 RepID=A0A8S3XSC0_PARAO|nr:unnamed protein product [Parnassius apollo]